MHSKFQSWFQSAKLTFDSEIQGNKIVDGRMVLGMRAGYESETENLLHEMSHFIEIDDARCASTGWGLSVNMAYFAGHPPGPDPRTFQAPAREIRVSAIQRVLSQHFNIEFDDFTWAKLIYDWVPGSCYVLAEFEGLPEWGDETFSYNEHIKLRCDKIKEAIVAQSHTWTIEQIRNEWDRKCQLLEQRTL